MQDNRVETLKQRLRRLFDVAIGGALAFAVIFGVSLAAPGGIGYVVWLSVLGFVLLVVGLTWLISRRITRVETEVRREGRTGELLRGEIARREKAEAALVAEELFPFYNPGPVLRFDRSGHVTKYNPAASELIGRERLVVATLLELVPGTTRQEIADCIERGVIEPREVQWGDRWFLCHFRGVPEMDTGMLYASDVTPMKQAEIEVRGAEIRARAILDGAADAIFIVVAGGIVQAANPATERLFGWPLEEIIGREVDLLLPDLFENRGGDRLELLIHYARRRRTGPVDRVFKARRRNGETFPAQLTISAYEVEGSVRCSCIVRDVSERVEAEELRQAQSEKLREQYVQMKQLVAELDEFNYVASHDLQEPLRTMSTYCGLLKKDLGENPPRRAVEDMQAILDASLRMQRLITDLLEYSRSGHRDLKLEVVDLARVMQRVKGDLMARLEETGGSIEWNGLPVVRGDDMQLGRVLQNLVANGLKFRRPGVPPLVQITAVQDGANVRLTVQDNGIGIEEKHLDQVFKPFKRLHGIGKYEGSGIGLSICRKIIERHGGAIEVASEPGVGSRFTVTLPAMKGSADGGNQHA
ncbi:MAG: PAS domain S-box protein [Planctomycetes bacterium]|nr:PAS domain S-box protein [Planctomycetota bacterium]MCW8136661.1 PAS domain S-box protein [Planctomycetota bacterium]